MWAGLGRNVPQLGTLAVEADLGTEGVDVGGDAHIRVKKDFFAFWGNQLARVKLFA